MLKDYLFKGKLGNIEDAHYIFSLIQKHRIKYQDLMTVCRKSSFKRADVAQGIIELLIHLDLIVHEEDSLVMINEINTGNMDIFTQHFFQHLFSKLEEYEILHLLYTSNNLMYDQEFSTYVIKENFIPMRLYDIKNFLLESNFLLRHELIKNLLMVNIEHLVLFQAYVIDVLNSPTHIKTTLDKLKSQLKTKEMNGEEAECFVLEYEFKRLSNHPQKARIEQVSHIDVSAGYDIKSFQSDTSVLIDMFIEVKSFNRDTKFYWSINEIEKAEILGDSYYLYLVDRSKMDDEQYIPDIIQNPYKEVFENSDYWNKEIQNWLFTYKK